MEHHITLMAVDGEGLGPGTGLEPNTDGGVLELIVIDGVGGRVHAGHEDVEHV